MVRKKDFVLFIIFSLFIIVMIQPIEINFDNTPVENLEISRNPIIHEPNLLTQAIDYDTFGISIDDQGELESPPYTNNLYYIGFQNWSQFMERRMYMKFDISELSGYGNLILPYLNVSMELTFGNAINSSGYSLPNMTFPLNISFVDDWNIVNILTPPHNMSKFPAYLNKSMIVNVSIEEGSWVTNTIDLTDFLNGTEEVSLMFTSTLENFRCDMFAHSSGDPTQYIPKLIITLDSREIPETPITYYTSLNEDNSKTIQYMHHHYLTFSSNYQIADFRFDLDCFKDPFYVDIIVWLLSEENYQSYIGGQTFTIRLRFYDPYYSESGYNNDFIGSTSSGMGFENGTYYLLFINLDSDNESVTINYDFDIELTDRTPEPDPEPDPTISGFNPLIIIGLITILVFYRYKKK